MNTYEEYEASLINYDAKQEDDEIKSNDNKSEYEYADCLNLRPCACCDGNTHKTYYCEICCYRSSNKCHFKSHMISKKHNKTQLLLGDYNTRTYTCEPCLYITDKLTNFKSHIRTNKHKMNNPTDRGISSQIQNDYNEVYLDLMNRPTSIVI